MKILVLTLLSQFAFAELAVENGADSHNKENVDYLKAMIFDPENKTKNRMTQLGKTKTGDTCSVIVTQSATGINFQLAIKGQTNVFNAYNSTAQSSHYYVINTDEGLIQVTQVELGKLNQTPFADKQFMALTTAENPGSDKNIRELTISNKITAKFDAKGNPDYTGVQSDRLSCDFVSK